MAQSGKPWHICDDCLDPLAHDLLSLALRFGQFFDVAKRDRLSAECRQIQEDTAYYDDRLTDAQRKRRDELLEQMRAQAEPPDDFEVGSLYQKYRIELAIDWLKLYVSVEYANDFKRTLHDAKERFSALLFRARQIFNGDEGKESTRMVRYPIQRLKDRHYELLRETFPDHEYPDREELPDDLRAFEIEILDEYTETENQIREAGYYLRRVSALVRAKMKKAEPPQPTANPDGYVSKADLDAVVSKFVEFKTIQNKFKPEADRQGSNKRSLYLYSRIRVLYLAHDTSLDRILPATYPEFLKELQSVQSGK